MIPLGIDYDYDKGSFRRAEFYNSAFSVDPEGERNILHALD